MTEDGNRPDYNVVIMALLRRTLEAEPQAEQWWRNGGRLHIT